MRRLTGSYELLIPLGWLLCVTALAEIILGALPVALAITGFTDLLTNRESGQLRQASGIELNYGEIARSGKSGLRYTTREMIHNA